MRVPRSRLAVAVAALIAALLLVAGCGASTPSDAPSGSPGPASGSPAPTPASTPRPSPAASAPLVLRATSEGGFIGPTATLAALPAVSVYADGMILVPAPQPAIDPAPLLPTVQIRDVGAAGAAAIVAAIRAAGLAVPAGDSGGIAADAGTTVITVSLDGRTVTTRLRGAGGGPPGPGGPGGPGSGSPDPRQAATLALLARLEDPGDSWGGTVTPPTTLAPAGFRIYAAPGAPPADAATPSPPVAWPLSTPLTDFGTPSPADRGIAGLRQGVALGSDAAILAPVLAAATTATGFTSEGATWTLYVRPLLPDELGG